MPIVPAVPPTTALTAQDPDIGWPTVKWSTAYNAAPLGLAPLIAEAFPDGGNVDEKGPLIAMHGLEAEIKVEA